MGKGENGHWTLDGHKHNECELTESDSAAFYQLSAELDNTLITLRFFLFFLLTCGDHATSVSDEIDQEIKVCQNIKFFLRFSVAIAT